jgi:stage V sporulation protein G
MMITDVRIKLASEEDKGDCLAYCQIVFDDMFIVNDIKVIRSTKGTTVAMPSRKLSSKCPHCRFKNMLKAKFCNNCGKRLLTIRPENEAYYADVAHPLTQECRAAVNEAVLRAYRDEQAIVNCIPAG